MPRGDWYRPIASPTKPNADKTRLRSASNPVPALSGLRRGPNFQKRHHLLADAVSHHVGADKDSVQSPAVAIDHSVADNRIVDGGNVEVFHNKLNESLGDLAVGPDRQRFWRVVSFALAQDCGVAYFPRYGSIVGRGFSDSRFQRSVSNATALSTDGDTSSRSAKAKVSMGCGQSCSIGALR